MAILIIGPATPMLIAPATGQVTLVANRDITNSILIGHEQGIFNTQSGGINYLDVTQVDPLSFTVFTGDDPIWAISLAGNVQVQVQYNATYWSPSPAQVAAQINALGLMKDTTGSLINTTAGGTTSAVNTANTSILAQTSGGTIANEVAAAGVPLLNKKSTSQPANSLAIAAGATTALTAVTGINQPAYNLHMTATAGASSTKPWYTVTVKWVDTASGFTVQIDQYTVFMSGTSNVLSCVIAGPTDADQLQVSVTNNDTVGMTLNTAFFVLSSRANYTSDIVYQFWTTASMPSVPTFQLGPSQSVPTQKIIFSLTRTVGVGVTTSPDYAMPVYAGQVAFGFRGVSSNQWHAQITDQFTGVILYSFDIASANNVNTLIELPRAPCTVSFTNNGSVLGTMNCEIIGL